MDPLSICKRALGWLGAKPIAKLDEASRSAELCNDNFAATRDAVLEAREWSFAVKRFTLEPLADKPVSGYSTAHQLGGDVLRVLQADVAADGDNRLQWAREGDCIVSDHAGTLYVRALVRVEDAKKWSPTFRMALAYRLASVLAIPVTENKSLQADLWQLYERELKAAAALDGMQGRNIPRRSSLALRRG